MGFYVPSHDGDTHSVTITVLDNALLEDDEAIEFSLTNLIGLQGGMVSLALPDQHTVTILDDEVNTAPMLDPVGNRTIAESVPLAFTVSGTDADVPEQTLTYSASGLPAGATFDPATGQFSWTPAETRDRAAMT